jgi:hypothetical protein
MPTTIPNNRSDPMPLVNFEKLHRSEFLIDLRAPPVQRWRAFGREHAADLHDLLGDIAELCDKHFQHIPRQLRPLARAAARGAGRVAGRLFATVASRYDVEYVDEIRGLAAAADAPFSDVLLANLIYDLWQFVDRRVGAAACSSFSCNVRGRPVLARNMDWCWPDTVGRHTVLIHFHRGRDSYLSIGVVGLVGILTAMHEGHRAVALNQAPAQRLSFNATQWPALHRLRAACDGLGTFRSLIRRLTAAQTMTAFFAHVVGTRPEEHVVVTSLGRAFATRRSTTPVLIQTNHFVDDDLEHLNPPEEFADDDGCVWYYNTRLRYGALRRRLRTLPRSLAAAITKIRRSPVTTEATMQSMSLCPANGRWLLRVAV